MTVSNIYKAITDFCKLAIDDENVKVIIANQSHSRPAKHFVSVALDAVQVAYEYDKEVKNGKSLHHLKSIADITIKCFADTIHTSSDILHKIHKAFYTDLTYDAFGHAFALAQILQDVSIIPTIFAEKTEEVALLEVRLNCYDSVTYSPSFIEHIELDGQIENLTFNVRI